MTNAIDAAQLKRYKDHKPTAFDHNIALRGEQAEQNEWLIAPCSHARDSDSLTESNWETQLKALKEVDAGEDYEVHHFGHWGPGWYEIVLVRPGSECHKVAAELACALERYPVLDETDWSTREMETAWKGTRVRDLLRDEGTLNARTIEAVSAVSEYDARYALETTCDAEIVDDYPRVNADRMQLAKFLVECRKQMKGAQALTAIHCEHDSDIPCESVGCCAPKEQMQAQTKEQS